MAYLQIALTVEKRWERTMWLQEPQRRSQCHHWTTKNWEKREESQRQKSKQGTWKDTLWTEWVKAQGERSSHLECKVQSTVGRWCWCWGDRSITAEAFTVTSETHLRLGDPQRCGQSWRSWAEQTYCRFTPGSEGESLIFLLTPEGAFLLGGIQIHNLPVTVPNSQITRASHHALQHKLPFQCKLSIRILPNLCFPIKVKNKHPQVRLFRKFMSISV